MVMKPLKGGSFLRSSRRETCRMKAAVVGGPIRRARSFVASLLILIFILDARVEKAGAENNVAAENDVPEEEAGGEYEEGDDNYLYNTDDAAPIVEYMTELEVDDKPEFVNRAQTHRVVEFYAPWCPHCQHFRDHYIEFARQVGAVTEEMGTETIDFYSVSCQVHKKLCKSFNITGFPRIHLFRKGSTSSTEALYYELHPFSLMNDLGIHTDAMRLEVDFGKLNERQLKREKSMLKHVGEFPRTKTQLFDDAFLSFDFNLRNGIFTSNEPLTNSTKLALHDWLELLKKSLPPAWQLQTVIDVVLENFEQATMGEENLLQVLSQAPSPPKKKWTSACTKGKPGMGYTCGLWSLFHIMTIGVVEWNMMLGENQLPLAISTVHAADTLRNFIENFFGCEVCRVNFLAAYDECSFGRCDRLTEEYVGYEHWIQLPVWLYETHNAVNVRLLKEEFERDNKGVPTHTDELNKQWPPREDCPKCWRIDDAWDEESVYNYLRIEYWPEDFVTEKLRQDLGDTEDDDLEEEEHSIQFGWFFVIGLLAALGAYPWLSKRQQIARSGRHKKIDA